MLERAGVLTRAESTGRLEGVYFCEQSETDFGTIQDLIGSPEQGFLGEFDKIVLFKDDDETTGHELYSAEDEPFTPEIRKKLRYKDAHNRLYQSFPFDVINLDVFGVMFPPRSGVVAPLIQSVIRLLKWQTELAFDGRKRCEQFTLFLTSHVEPAKMNIEAVQQLTERLQDNINNHEEFRSVFQERYGHSDAERLASSDFAEFFCVSLPKFIIHLALIKLGWTVKYKPIYLYNREDTHNPGQNYQIMHSVSVYERMKDYEKYLDGRELRLYTQTSTDILKTGVEWVDSILSDASLVQELQKDLSEIIKFRELCRQ